MTLKIKVKGVNEYQLSGVQKIKLDKEYLYTTIFDTRKYRRCDIESIEVSEKKKVSKSNVSKRDQKVAADILTAFMFTKTMDDVINVWDDLFEKYDLYSDPFTNTPVTAEEYAKNRLEYDRQTMIERYGHCDGLG